MVNIIDILQRLENEDDLDYHKRLIFGKLKDKTLADQDYCELAELVYGKKYSSDVARRMMYGSRATLDLIDFDRHSKISDEEVFKKFAEKEIDIQKQLVKFRDYRNIVTSQIRSIARADNMKDIAIQYAEDMNKHFPMQLSNENMNDNCNSKCTGILNLSDWHFGLEIDNYLNVFNVEVFNTRIKSLVCQVIDKINLYEIETLYILNLNDLCSGIIHNSIRLQNRENIIEQIMYVSETMAELLNVLSKYVNIKYYSVIDNHSRCIADKKDSLENENYSLIVDWFLKTRFKNIKNIEICENEFDNETITFKIYNYNYLAVHGHKDKISNIVQNLSLMTKRFYNAMFTAHLHHSHSDEIHGTYVYSNGCVSGVDSHSKDLRKSSNPSQTMVIVTPEDCLYGVHILKV